MQTTGATPQIFVNGRIVSASNFDSQEMFIKWGLIIGSNFKVIDGKIKGETFQVVTEGEDKYVPFDHPMLFNLSCTSIKGWPKFLVELWSTDSDNRNSLIGYGTSFLPFRKG